MTTPHRGFYTLHPAVSFIFYGGYFLFSMLFLHPIYLSSALLIGIIMNWMHDHGNSLKRFILWYILTCFVLSLLNPLFSHRGEHILFYVMNQPITLESVMFGVIMALSILVLLAGFLSFNLIIQDNKLMYLFSASTPKLALLVIVAIRFVPLLLRRLNEIMIVQQTKGISVHEGSWIERARHGMTLVQILLSWSLEEAMQTADSMKARGYGLRARSSYISYRLDYRDVVVLSVTLLLGILCLICWRQGYGVLNIYPSLEGIKLSGADLVTYYVYLYYLLIPLGVEGEEVIRWRFSR